MALDNCANCKQEAGCAITIVYDILGGENPDNGYKLRFCSGACVYWWSKKKFYM